MITDMLSILAKDRILRLHEIVIRADEQNSRKNSCSTLY